MNFIKNNKRSVFFLLFSVALSLILWRGILFEPGFVLRLDLTWAPGMYPRDSLHIGSPIEYILHFGSIILSGEIMQRLVLITITTLLVFSGYVLAKRITHRFWIQVAVSIIILCNPFIFSRLLAGQMFVIAGVALLALFISEFLAITSDYNSKHLIRQTMILFSTLIISPHFAFIMLIVAGFYLLTNGQKLFKINRNMFFGYSAIAVLGIGVSILYSATNTFKEGELILFATYEKDSLGSVGTLLALQGFWGERSLFDSYLPAVLITILLTLSVVGFAYQIRYKTISRLAFLASSGIVGIIVSLGAKGAFSELFLFLYRDALLLNGFREPQKFIGLYLVVLLAFAAYGAHFIAEIAGDLKLYKDIKTKLSAPELASKFKTMGKLSAVGITTLLAPLTSLQFFQVINDELQSYQYPEMYEEANMEFANFEESEGREPTVLVLPWDGYIKPDWVDFRIADPSMRYFKATTVSILNYDIDSGIILDSSERFKNEIYREFGEDINTLSEIEGYNNVDFWRQVSGELEIDYLWTNINSSYYSTGDIVLEDSENVLYKL